MRFISLVSRPFSFKNASEDFEKFVAKYRNFTRTEKKIAWRDYNALHNYDLINYVQNFPWCDKTE